jgi:hypothetical protein
VAHVIKTETIKYVAHVIKTVKLHTLCHPMNSKTINVLTTKCVTNVYKKKIKNSTVISTTY